MAEIFNPDSVYPAFVARQRAGLAQVQRPSDGATPRTDTAGARDARSQEIRTDQRQRDGETQRFESARNLQGRDRNAVFTRTIDERGNDIAGEVRRDESQQQVQEQRDVQAARERQLRLEERQAQRDQAVLQSRLDRENASEQISQASYDPALPRGSVIDIVA